MTIAAILNGKGSEVVQARSGDAVLEVARLLAERRIGCVPVVEEGAVVGIFSERDLLYHLAEEGPDVLGRSVAEIMTAPAISIDRETPVLVALSLMTRRRVRHLPVVEDGALLGIVSIGDLVKYRIDRIESEAAALRDYIQSA